MSFSQSEHPGWKQPCLRVGHGGAAGLLPANTLPSLEHALALGVDMVEFDVRPCRDALVLAHDDEVRLPDGETARLSSMTLVEVNRRIQEPGRRLASLDEALDLVGGKALINLDLKTGGMEAEAVHQVRARGLGGEVLYSSLEADSLRRVRAADREALTGFSYPEDRGNASGKAWMQPVVTLALAWMRLRLPGRVAGMMAKAQADGLMLYHKVISPAVVAAVQQAGGRVFAWTVDDPERMVALQKMGVNGITSNHPERLAVLDKEARQR